MIAHLQNPVVTPGSATNYTVTVTDLLTGCTFSDALTVIAGIEERDLKCRSVYLS